MDLYKQVNGKRVKLSEEEIKKLQAEWDANALEQAKTQYIHDRLAAYPSAGEQLDLLYHAMSKGEIPVATEWFNLIKQIKEENPKP